MDIPVCRICCTRSENRSRRKVIWIRRGHRAQEQAVACYQAAMQVAPNQTDVANQLGYTLITLDRIDEAYATLSTSLTQKQTAAAWNNMAEIYRRRGAISSADYAVQQANALSTNQPQYGPENPLVTEVDPLTFARISPMPLQTPSSTPNQSNANSSPDPPRRL